MSNQMSVRQYVISDPPNIIYIQTQNVTTGIPSTVWQQQMDNARIETHYIIHSDHPYLHTYVDAVVITTSPKLNSDLYKLSKITTLSTMTLSMAKTRTGMISYTTRVSYSFVMKTILQQMMRTIRTY